MKRVLLIFMSTMSMYIISFVLALILIPMGTLLALCILDKIEENLKRFFASSLFWIIGKNIAVVGLENIQKDQKYLIVSNYPSLYVTFALMKFLPNISFIADDYILKIPVVGPILKDTGAIFVNQKKPRKTKEAIDKALNDPAKDVQYLLMYPEGKRSTDGKIDKFKYGFKYILRHSSYNLLPITANGFYRLKPVRRIYLDPYANLEIIFHKPIANSDIQQMSNKELILMTEDIIRKNYTA